MPATPEPTQPTPGGDIGTWGVELNEYLQWVRQTALDALNAAEQAIAALVTTNGVATNDPRLADARIPVAGSVTNSHVAANAAISLDKTADGTARVALSPAERTKLQTLAAVAVSGSYSDMVGEVPPQHLPDLAITKTWPADSQAAMLALPALEGHVAIRSDITTGPNSFILSAEPATNLANWKALSNSSAVTAVAGRTGAVVLTKSDVGLGNVDNTADLNKPVSTAQAEAINLRAFDSEVVKHASPATITATHTYQAPPVFTDGAIPVAKIAGLQDILTELQNRPTLQFTPNSTDALPQGTKEGDWVGAVTVTTTSEPEPPAPPALPASHWDGADIAASTILTQSLLGTGDTDPFDTVTGSPIIRVTGSLREIEAPNNTSTTKWHQTGFSHTAFGGRFYYRIGAFPAAVQTFFYATGVFRLAITSSGNINLLTSTGTYVTQSTPIDVNTRVRINYWRDATTDSTHIRVYKADGSLHWSADRALGLAAMTERIYGRNTTTAYGPQFFSGIWHDPTATEWPA